MLTFLPKIIFVSFVITSCSSHTLKEQEQEQEQEYATSATSATTNNSTTTKRNLRTRSLQQDETIYEDIPDMSDEDIKRVMDWIAAEVTMVKNPFCWKDSYGRGVGTVPGRVADCPTGYTNNGLTCGRDSDDILAPSKVASCPSGYTNMGNTCFRGMHSIHASSRAADCPSGYSNTGLTCHRWWPPHTLSGGPSRFTCPSGYFKSSITARCHKICPSGYRNDGEFCTRDPHSLGMSSMTCPSGYFQSKATARCHKICPAGYTNTGETCHRPVSTKGLGSMSCRAGERPYLSGARCFPSNGDCYGNKEEDAGLCYPKCREGFDGVGPVCWGSCDNSMVSCGLACAKTSADCAIAVVDQVISPLILAANVASLGLATPATAGATTTIRVGGKTVAGTSKVGKALVSAVSKLQTINPSGLTKGASVVRRVVQAKTGTVLKRTVTSAKVGWVQYKAMKQFRQTFAEDFAAQTSPDIARDLDSHFHPTTATFLKGLWGERMMSELAEANGWQIASTTLSAVAIVDITGITGVVSAYAKPVCNAIVPFPCTSADLKCKRSEPKKQEAVTIHSGDWGNWKYPWRMPAKSGYFACGAKLRVESRLGSGDDTAANGLELQFCNLQDWVSTEAQIIYEGNWGPPFASMEWKMCPTGKFIFGAQVRYESPQGSGDDTALNGLRIFCRSPGSNDESEVTVENGHWGTWRTPVKRWNKFVKGAVVKYEDKLGSNGDDTAMNGIAFLMVDEV